MLIPLDRQIEINFQVLRNDGTTWEDYSSYFSKASIQSGSFAALGTGSSGSDLGIRTSNITLVNEMGTRFNPLDEGSLINLFDNNYNPLLYFNREVNLQVRISTPKTYYEDTIVSDNTGLTTVYNLAFENIEDGTALTVRSGIALDDMTETVVYEDYRVNSINTKTDITYTIDYVNGTVTFDRALQTNEIVLISYYYEGTSGDWETYFRGVIKNITPNKHSVEIECQDFSWLLSNMIEETRTYGTDDGEYLEIVAQQILTDNGFTDSLYTINTPVSPNAFTRTYQLENLTPFQALRQLADQIGWFIGYWLEGTTSSLKFFNPDRDKLKFIVNAFGKTIVDETNSDINFQLESNEIYDTSLKLSNVNVRNKAKVYFNDKDTNTKLVAEAEDLTSQSIHGIKPIKLELDSTTNIDNITEAQTLADVIIHDLKQISADIEVTTPLYNFQVFDVGSYNNPHIDSEKKWIGIDSVSHTIDVSDPEKHTYRTKIRGTQNVNTGSNKKYLKMQSRFGASNPILPEQIVTEKLVFTPTLTVDSIGLDNVGKDTTSYINYKLTKSKFSQNVNLFTLQIKKTGDSWDNSTDYNVEINNGLYRYQKVSVNGNVSYTARILAINKQGTLSSWSSEIVQISPKDTTAPSMPSDLTVSIYASKSLQVQWSPNNEADFAYYRIYAKKNGVPVIPDDFTKETISTNTILSNLEADTFYGITVIAYDTSGNASVGAYSFNTTKLIGDEDLAEIRDGTLFIKNQTQFNSWISSLSLTEPSSSNVIYSKVKIKSEIDGRVTNYSYDIGDYGERWICSSNLSIIVEDGVTFTVGGINSTLNVTGLKIKTNNLYIRGNFNLYNRVDYMFYAKSLNGIELKVVLDNLVVELTNSTGQQFFMNFEFNNTVKKDIIVRNSYFYECSGLYLNSSDTNSIVKVIDNTFGKGRSLYYYECLSFNLPNSKGIVISGNTFINSLVRLYSSNRVNMSGNHFIANGGLFGITISAFVFLNDTGSTTSIKNLNISQNNIKLDFNYSSTFYLVYISGSIPLDYSNINNNVGEGVSSGGIGFFSGTTGTGLNVLNNTSN